MDDAARLWLSLAKRVEDTTQELVDAAITEENAGLRRICAGFAAAG